MTTLKSEPVVVGNAIGALIPLVTGVLATFHVFTPSPDQLGALTALYAGVLTLVTAFTRSKVTPTP